MTTCKPQAVAGVPRLVPQAAVPGLPRPTWDQARVLSHDVIGTRYHRVACAAPTIAAASRAGQFVMITVDDAPRGHLTLPRPMAIHRRRADLGVIEFVFDVVGRGTKALAQAVPGDSLMMVGPLGNGFPPACWTAGDSVLLLGRGIGVCGVMTVAEDAADAHATTVAIFSGREPENVIGMADAAELGIDAMSVDDQSGTSHPGMLRAELVRRFARRPPSAMMVCGSRRLGLLAAELSRLWDIPLSVSIESRMACGLGYCHGCALPAGHADAEGPLACVDGPVFSLILSDEQEGGVHFLFHATKIEIRFSARQIIVNARICGHQALSLI
ncbi:MAG TPA: hypothetical protein VFO01_14430 [Trebonia sp.]|nr:hypothetical protein [Trebonia sp.]